MEEMTIVIATNSLKDVRPRKELLGRKALRKLCFLRGSVEESIEILEKLSKKPNNQLWK